MGILHGTTAYTPIRKESLGVNYPSLKKSQRDWAGLEPDTFSSRVERLIAELPLPALVMIADEELIPRAPYKIYTKLAPNMRWWKNATFTTLTLYSRILQYSIKNVELRASVCFDQDGNQFEHLFT